MDIGMMDFSKLPPEVIKEVLDRLTSKIKNKINEIYSKIGDKDKKLIQVITDELLAKKEYPRKYRIYGRQYRRALMYINFFDHFINHLLRRVNNQEGFETLIQVSYGAKPIEIKEKDEECEPLIKIPYGEILENHIIEGKLIDEVVLLVECERMREGLYELIAFLDLLNDRSRK